MADPRITITKDPAAKLDYGRDWSDWLADVSDSLALVGGSTWAVVPDDSLEADGLKIYGSNWTAAGMTSIWLEGGKPGTDYRLTNRATTVGERVDERTVTIKVRER